MFLRSHYKLNSFYSKILFYITLVLVSTIFLTSSILYFNFEKIGLSLIHSSTKDSLSQISYSTTYMTNTVKTLALQTYFDQDISKLLLFDSIDVHTEYAALNKLSNLITKTQFIHSIYLYNGRAQTAYSSLLSGKYDTKSFPDQEAIELLNDPAHLKNLSPIPRLIYDDIAQINKGFYSNVYTFVFHENVIDNSGIDRAVVLNITEGWMREIMDSLETSSESQTFIVDSKGMIVNSVVKGKILVDISDKNYIKEILNSNEPSGFFVEEVDNVKSLITYVSSPNIDWKFIQITPYSNITKKINTLKYTTLFICFIVLLLGSFASIYISKKLYKPYSIMDEKLKALQSEKNSSSSVLKQDFLRSQLLNTTHFQLSEFEDKVRNLKVNINFNNEFLLILIKIDNYTDFVDKYNINDRNLFKFGIMNIALELFNTKYSNEAIDMQQDHMVLITNITDDITDQDINFMINEFQKAVKKHLELSISISISSAGNSKNDLSMLYSEALDAYNYFLFNEYECILWSKNIDTLEQNDYVYPTQKENLLIDALMLRKIDEAKEIYLDIISGTKGHSFNIFHTAILRISLALNTLIESLRQNSNVYVNFNFSNFSSTITKKETINEINNCFFYIFKSITEKLEERQSMKHDTLASNIIEIINQSYMDPNLSLDSIADKVNLSSSYVGKLFKKLTSKSISEVITEVRMEKAKELLKTTNMSVSEIVENVGFASSAYFYPLFKKMNGVTPNDYRQSGNINK